MKSAMFCFTRIIALTACLLITLSGNTYARAQKTQKIERLPMEDVQRFTAAMSQVKNYYVKPVKDKKLFDEAIRGMLKGLDPHSDYLDAKDFKALKESTRGEFSGLGIEVTMENGVIKVISPIDGTPAQKAGLKSGDLIIRLDDRPVKGMTLRDAVNAMRGRIGTSINILVIRKKTDKPLKFKITRARIHIQSVKSKLLDKKYGYIRISHFQEPTGADLKKALVKLRKESKGQLKGLILDLRNNPGGLLDAAIDVSDMFIHHERKGKKKMIVYTKGRLPGSKFSAYANPGDILQKAPLVVLINGGSASASEIVAGALKDHGRAIIMGERSFGKGSVQTVLPLDKNHGIKITTALYYTPKGRSIQAKGIKPDIIVQDIVIPQKKGSNLDLLSLKEADLHGHLANGNKKGAKLKSNLKNSKGKKTKETKLIHRDYQLYEALNLLKGLSLRGAA